MSSTNQQSSSLISTHYSRLVILGDSNADNGNVLRLTHGAHPAPSSVYWQGRYSNGKVWADHLAELASPASTINLAYGCATIDNNIVSGTVPMPDGQRVEVPSVTDQINDLESLVGRLSPTDLVLIQVGSNDLNSLIDTGSLYRRKCAFTPLQLAERLAQAVEYICTQLGARNVLVLNVRPREDYPGVIALNDRLVLKQTCWDTTVFNATVSNKIAALQAALGADYRLSLFDTYSAQKEIALVADPVSGKLSSDPELFVDSCHLGSRAQMELFKRIFASITQI
ncbi:hypothetical protein J3B01_000439 [Coemansia erecta]|nr:hypothetical protein IWW49_004851 [Coemansia sp. RSA 1797]KAJ2839736.1 hypothetical protein J3B01_000439 [Coemansia erecta]